MATVMLYGGEQLTIPPEITIYSLSDSRVICRNSAECANTTDQTARRVYETIVLIYNFFKERFLLNGINNNGEIPPIYIDWTKPNAAWACLANQPETCHLRFWNPLTQGDEVIAHEYTHGIISRLTPLTLNSQSGALHESLADVFAIVFEHWKAQKTGHQTNWKIVDIRDLSSHVTMNDFATNPNDRGSVHLNSRIPSHAFYQAVKLSGEGPLGNVTTIWYNAMLQLEAYETFDSFAHKTIEQIKSCQPPLNQRLFNVISEAWKHVGINVLSGIVVNF